MILCSIADLYKYCDMDPGLAMAAEFIGCEDLDSYVSGRHFIDDDVYVIIEDQVGKGTKGARLEAHKRYIDIQFCLAGEDTIGIKPVAECGEPTEPYSEEKDIMFFPGEATEWVTVNRGTCVVIFPEDAHAPLAGNGPVRKAVFKVRDRRIV
ncbi:MAG: YhcH/YjgK/YiaL family protein [Candidatus Omnitrophica bacterium]|nr:YhcH/YjgK/YiaL family protein [Candidatus Omnitrophota bacterium]MDD5488480.1 YhcH/YjgK/YiaL family protein [Candidatus Omnitrophota bacterium]